MLPTEQGRFCDACIKEVIDFTKMHDKEILAYFSSQTQQPVCGRFYKHQIDRIRIEIPEYLLFAQLPFWKKFILIFMICFGLQQFNIDCYLCDSNQLHARAINSLNHSNTSTKKKKNSKPEICLNETPIPFTIDQTIIISGNSSVEPEKPLPHFDQDYSILALNKGALNLKNDGLLVQNSSTPKRNPPSKDSDQNNAAALPTLLSKNRRKRGNDR